MLFSRSTLESFYTVPEPNSNPVSNTTSSNSKRNTLDLDRGHLLPGKTHQRAASNPFEIIYDPDVVSSVPQHSNRSIDHLKSPGYLDIERTIDQGHAHRRNRSSQIFSNTPSPSRRSQKPEEHSYSIDPLAYPSLPAESNIPPVVTIIGDQSILKRAGSVISTEASLRHRNSIRNRSRMVKRTDLQPLQPTSIPQTPPKKPTRRLRFTFPVKRQKSLKRNGQYHSVLAGPAKFETARELYNFYFDNDGPRMIRELLPHSMLSFAYSKLPNINPTLNQRLRRTKMDNTYTSIFLNSQQRKQISAPVEGTFKKNNVPIANDPTSHYDLSRAIFDKYRNAVFANKIKAPLTFFEVFPEERRNSFVTMNDAEFYTTRLLLEILLRRTVAAKINYRLKGRKLPNFKTSSDPDLSNDSGSKDGHYNKHDSLPKLSSDSGNSDSDSVNTDDLMQQNASLYSGLLPSPQISYSSNIFGSDFDLAPINEKRSATASPRAVRPIAADDLSENHLFKQDSYRLQPMNRSIVTLSSSDDDSVTPVDNSSADKLSTIESDVRNSSSSKEVSSRDFSSHEIRRKSLSTANSSLLHYLDDLTSELSSFIKEDNLKKEHNKVQDNSALPPIMTKQHMPQVNARHVDIMSQKASIDAASTAASTSPSKMNYNDTDTESGFRVVRREDSVSTKSGVYTIKDISID